MPATLGSAQEQDLNSTSLLTSGVILATVTMTFGAMIAVFVVRSQSQVFWGHLAIPSALWASTAVLIASTVTLEKARRYLKENLQKDSYRLLVWTTALGIAFLVGQIIGWVQFLLSGVVLAGNPHSWFIFLFTALHGLHILLGLGGLGYLLVRTREPVSGPRYQMKTRAITNGVALFWHYLDFLWLVLFALLVLWRR